MEEGSRWPQGRTAKKAHYVKCGGGALYCAGIYDAWRDPESGAELETFAIITVPAAAELAALHHRQPAFLDAGAEAAEWLSGTIDGAVGIARPRGATLAGRLQYHRVTSDVGRASYQDADCSLEVKSTPQKSIASFFERSPSKFAVPVPAMASEGRKRKAETPRKSSARKKITSFFEKRQKV